MNAETDAVLSILIAEITDILDDAGSGDDRIGRVRELLDSWISANGLRVREVEVLTREEFARRFDHRADHTN